MATFDDIKDVRLRISDPSGFINLLEVAALPTTPAHQTAYKLTTDNIYYYTDVESGAVASDYIKIDLQISDSRLSAWIDAEDTDYATCKSYDFISTQLGKKMMFVRNSSGVESTEYTSLKDMYTYYKILSDECKKNRRSKNLNITGRYLSFKQPTIAGGNI